MKIRSLTVAALDEVMHEETMTRPGLATARVELTDQATDLGDAGTCRPFRALMAVMDMEGEMVTFLKVLSEIPDAVNVELWRSDEGQIKARLKVPDELAERAVPLETGGAQIKTVPEILAEADELSGNLGVDVVSWIRASSGTRSGVTSSSRALAP